MTPFGWSLILSVDSIAALTRPAFAAQFLSKRDIAGSLENTTFHVQRISGQRFSPTKPSFGYIMALFSALLCARRPERWRGSPDLYDRNTTT